jgi:hypothetical protein
MASSSDRYRLIVAGPIAQAAAELIEARFGVAAAIHGLDDNTAVDLTADQPSLRALVTLLWDLGHELLAILKFPDARRAHTPT